MEEEKVADEEVEEKKADVKVVMEEKISSIKKEVTKKIMKLVLGEDIRRAQLPTKGGCL